MGARSLMSYHTGCSGTVGVNWAYLSCPYTSTVPRARQLHPLFRTAVETARRGRIVYRETQGGKIFH